MTWRSIEELPEGKVVILWQSHNDDRFRSAGMVIGSIEREGWEKHDPPFWVRPDNIAGHEMECDITHPTHWMELPSPPDQAMIWIAVYDIRYDQEVARQVDEAILGVQRALKKGAIRKITPEAAAQMRQYEP